MRHNEEAASAFLPLDARVSHLPLAFDLPLNPEHGKAAI